MKLIIGIIMSSNVLWANPRMETTYYEKLLSLKSAKQVHGLQEQYEKMKYLKLQCRSELDKSWAPVSCYELVYIKSRKAWISQRQAGERLSRLERPCMRAKKVKSSVMLDFREMGLSAACRENIKRLLLVKEYKSVVGP